jgi:hypothetical protein
MTPKSERNIRVAATSKIWSFATGMLALCIPLSSVTKSGAILLLLFWDKGFAPKNSP